MTLRAQHIARPSPEDLWHCLVVVRSGTHYALTADVVRGLGSTAEDVPQSDLLAHFPGVPTAGTPARVVLCGVRTVQQAVLVDEVLGLTQVARSDIRPLPGQFVGHERLWFSGLFLFQSSVALVVNPEWLLVQSAQALLMERPVHDERSQSPGAAPETVAGPRITDPFDGVVLEEASDAEDTPWAEL